MKSGLLNMEEKMPPLIRSTDRKRRETVFRFSGTGFTLFLSALVAGMGWAPRTADAQALSERDVLVVYNGDSPVSRAAAYYYAFSRQLSQEMLLDLSIPLADPMLGDPADETITRAGYEALIQAPVAARLAELGEAAPLWIATVMGVPLRIPDDSDSELLLVDSTGASVDAELAVLGSGLEGSAGILNSKNPYFGALDGFGPWRASNPDSPLRYLVTRIAAYPTERDQFELPASVRSLIDGAVAPSDPSAVWVVDEDGTGTTSRSPVDLGLLRPATGLLRFLGLPVLHDVSTDVLHDIGLIAAYASWGSNDSNRFSAPYFGAIGDAVVPGNFGPRSISATIVSTNARSFVAPPIYGQSLAADLIDLGANGVAGNVSEPGVFQVAHPQIMFARYAAGSTAAEAYYASVPYLGWQNVFIGDPLMRYVDDDRDGDGIEDRLDDCTATPAGTSVDAAGCSSLEFCRVLDPVFDQSSLIHACLGADWRGNETSSHKPKDCDITAGPNETLLCVVGEGAQ
jgi:uncharacterized protein (TIGR03790 family)